MKRILALVLHAALRGHRDFHCGERADGANLTCLNFTGKQDLARQNTDLICAGLNFEDEKFYKAAGARQNLTPLQNSDISNFVFYLGRVGGFVSRCSIKI